MKQMVNYFSKIVDGGDTASSKRLVTLLIALHFIVSSFATLIVAIYVIFHVPKGQVDEKLLNLLREILQYDFYIILSGLGFITMEGFTQVMIERAKLNWPGGSTPVATTTTTTKPYVPPSTPENEQE